MAVDRLTSPVHRGPAASTPSTPRLGEPSAPAANSQAVQPGPHARPFDMELLPRAQSSEQLSRRPRPPAPRRAATVAQLADVPSPAVPLAGAELPPDLVGTGGHFAARQPTSDQPAQMAAQMAVPTHSRQSSITLPTLQEAQSSDGVSDRAQLIRQDTVNFDQLVEQLQGPTPSSVASRSTTQLFGIPIIETNSGTAASSERGTLRDLLHEPARPAQQRPPQASTTPQPSPLQEQFRAEPEEERQLPAEEAPREPEQAQQATTRSRRRPVSMQVTQPQPQATALHRALSLPSQRSPVLPLMSWRADDESLLHRVRTGGSSTYDSYHRLSTLPEGYMPPPVVEEGSREDATGSAAGDTLPPTTASDLAPHRQWADAAAATGAGDAFPDIARTSTHQTRPSTARPLTQAFDVEASPAEREDFIRSLTPSAATALHAVLSEAAAKGIPSFLHFGLAQAFSAVAAEKLLDYFQVDDPAQRTVAESAIQAVAVGGAHYLCEIMLRPALLQLFGASAEATNPRVAIPDSSPHAGALRTQLSKQQAAARIGQPVGDTLALAGFVFAHMGRKVLAGGASENPLVNSLASGIGGALGTGAQTLVNMNSHVDDEGLRVPAHSVKQGFAPQDIPDAVRASIRATTHVTGSDGKPSGNAAGNVAQDLFVRTFGLFQGLMIKTAITSVLANDSTAHEAINGAIGPVGLLGLAYFANLSLLAMRGKVDRSVADRDVHDQVAHTLGATIKAVENIDPGKALGSTEALVARQGAGPSRTLAQAAAVGIDRSHQMIKSVVGLPGYLAMDVREGLVNAGAGAISNAAALVKRGFQLAADMLPHAAHEDRVPV
jgi:hypothetical protein